MSKEQELSKAKELANKGYFTKNKIEEVIKSDFLDNYHRYKSLMDLYSHLAQKYGKGKSTIMKICN